MKHRTWLLIPASLALLAVAAVVQAHNAICSCFENDKGAIVCEGGFSDGGKAVGVPMKVFDKAGKVLIQGVMDKKSEFTFPKPKVPYRVEFNGGEGHIVKIDGRDIEK